MRDDGPPAAEPSAARGTEDAASRLVAPGALTVRSQRRSGTVVLELTGELDLATVDLARDALRELEAEQPERLVIDLSHLKFIDSVGIHLVLAAHQRLARGGVTKLEIRSGGRAVQRVFEVTRLDEVLPFVDP
jgi:anti-sigma B factor antagonist